MRLVLIGDIHYYRLFTAPWNLIGKRVLGKTNLWLRRRKVFLPAALPAVVERVLSLAPDRVVFSGDLTTTALRPEFEDVRRVLRPLLDRFPTLIIPGNHDRYTFASKRKRRIEEYFPDQSPPEYPHLAPLTGAWRLMAIDASVPQWLSSRGRCGAAQLDRARWIIDEREDARNILLLCHYPAQYPPAIRGRDGHRLDDAAELLEALKTAAPRRVLYLHGHIHRPWIYNPEDKALSHVTFVNAGAPCHVSEQYPFGQGFWEIDLPEDTRHAVSLTHHLPVANGGWEVDRREAIADCRFQIED